MKREICVAKRVDELWADLCGTCTMAQVAPLTEASVATSRLNPKQLSSFTSTIIARVMSDATEQPKKERFAPKEPVTLQPPKDDIIDRDHLAKCDGTLHD